MASAEAATASQGPRYAPEDPTLPKPWRGLVDGSTGLLYYWNPETNVTQYERPSSTPPLPPGPPPSTSTPKVAPLPMARTLPSDGPVPQQPGQQMVQQPGQQVQQQQPSQQMIQQTGQPIQQQQLGQQIQQQQLGQQLGQHMPLQSTQQMSYHLTQPMMSQHAQQMTQQNPQLQLQQIPYPQMSYLQGQLMVRPQGQQQPELQVTYQLGQQQPQGVKVAYPQGQQPQEMEVNHRRGQQQHGLQALHQQGQQSQGPQVMHQQGQHPQGPQIAVHQQGQQIGFLRLEESGRQDLKQTGISFPQVQQFGGMPSNYNLPAVASQVQISQAGVHSVQTQQQQLGGQPSVTGQQIGASSGQLQQSRTETSYQQQQTGSPMIPNQLGYSMVRPMGSQMGYENRHERPGNEFNSASRIEGPILPPQLPKLAAIPFARNPQDMRMGPINPKFASPGHSGGLNMVPGNTMPNMYNSPAFPSAASMRPPPGLLGSPDFIDTTAADAYRQHHEVTATGDNVPAPFMTFEATGFPPEILREMHSAGFLSPTPIQAQTWPVALQSRDIVAIAKTGSGKTLGYLIPAFIHLRQCRNNPQFGPTVLVMAPTRELATQIQEEALKFGRSSRVSCTCLYGGAPKGPQLKEIERGADIIVATPGRLNDILEMRKISFRQVSFLVLDEADRMLDMGFEPQIRKIVDEIPPRRQTLMYTATWPKEVRKIAGDLLVNPVQVNIGSVNELAANKSITQYVEVVSPMDKQRRLEQILGSQERGSKIIIFCSTKKLCDQLARSIGRNFGATSIHGDKSQVDRDQALNLFRSGRAPILVATDVAARGLDIKDIRVVINYDFPTGIEDYVHRIGRTGRAGATGVSYTFFSDQDWKYAADLVKVLEGANQEVPPEVREMAARGGPPAFLRPLPHGGIGRWDSGGGGGGRWESGGGRGGGMRDFGGRGFGGRGGGRNDFYGGRGSVRGRGFGGPGGPGGWGRHDRGPHDRFPYPNGRGRYDGGRRGFSERSRGRSYSRSPERVRTWGYDRSRSGSRSRSRSWSRSRSRSRSWSRSPSRSRSRTRSRSYDRYDRVQGRDFSHLPPLAGGGRTGFEAPRVSKFHDAPHPPSVAGGSGAPGFETPRVSGFHDAPHPPPVAGGSGLPGFEAPRVSGFHDAPHPLPLAGEGGLPGFEVPRASGFRDAPQPPPGAGGGGLLVLEAPRASGFHDAPHALPVAGSGLPGLEPPPRESGFHDAPLSDQMSPMSPGQNNGLFAGDELAADGLPIPDGETGVDQERDV